jgi:ATP-dependent Clp protease ATP-binding subunit ClpC
LRRAIENLIENPLSEEILRNTFKGKDVVKAVVTGDSDNNKKLVFVATSKQEREEAAALVSVGEQSPAAPDGSAT